MIPMEMLDEPGDGRCEREAWIPSDLAALAPDGSPVNRLPRASSPRDGRRLGAVDSLPTGPEVSLSEERMTDANRIHDLKPGESVTTARGFDAYVVRDSCPHMLIAGEVTEGVQTFTCEPCGYVLTYTVTRR